MPSAAAQPQPQTQSTLSSKTLPPSAMPLVAPKALLHAHLSQRPTIRPSGRTPTQTRPISLNIGSLTHCHGSSVVKIGHTTIICGVRAEILPVSEIPSYNTRKDYEIDPSTLVSGDEPATRQKTYDPIALYHLVTPNLDLSTGCSPSHAPNTAPSMSAQSLTQRLYTLLVSTGLLSSTDLEIYYTPPDDVGVAVDPDDPAYVSGADQPQLKAYWALYVDVMCISHGGEGSVHDAAWFGIVAALRDTLLPRAWWDADLGAVICDEDVRRGKKLDVRSTIVPLSFGAFEMDEEQAVVLLDQDAFEEECCAERGCVAVDAATGKIVRVEKSGGSLVGVDKIEGIVQAARQRGAEWKQVLEQALSVARE